MSKKLKSPLDAATCSPSSLTPETDAMIAADQHHLEDDNFFPATVYWRMCDVALALERKRDEWRKKAVDLHARYKGVLEDIETEIVERNFPENAGDWEALTPIRQRIEFLENSLRDIALFVSVGGYNNDEIPADIVDRIKDGIISLCNIAPTTKTEESQ